MIHRLLVIIKSLIDFFVKTWEARRTITACVDSVVNFSGHEVSLGFLGYISFYPIVFILVDTLLYLDTLSYFY